jgi:hypothetical protein
MAVERIDHRTYAPQGATWDDAQRADFFGKVQKGQAVDGRQGFTWQHDGSGWTQSDEGAPAGTPGAGSAPPPAPPAAGEGPTTPPGEPQRPSAMPPSPPPAQTPAPSIPLGPTGQPQASTSPTTQPGVPGQNGRVTAPGLIDASQQTVPTVDDPIDAAFRQELLELLGRDPDNVSLTDADIAPQQRASQAAIERAALKNRAGLMERASAEGMADSEGVRAQGRAIESQAGRDIASSDAALLTQSMTARREQLNQALQIANARGMQQQANDLQRQIANLDAQLQTRGQDISREGLQLQRDLAGLDTNTKQYLADLDAKLRREGYGTQERLAQLDAEVRKLGINTQGNIGNLEIALRRELGIGELNLGLLQALLQNQQFNNGLGVDIGKWQSILNKDSLLAAL